MERQREERTLTASAASKYVRHPDRRVDERGVVIGPWTAGVRRANRLLHEAARPTLKRG